MVHHTLTKIVFVQRIILFAAKTYETRRECLTQRGNNNTEFAGKNIIILCYVSNIFQETIREHQTFAVMLNSKHFDHPSRMCMLKHFIRSFILDPTRNRRELFTSWMLPQIFIHLQTRRVNKNTRIIPTQYQNPFDPETKQFCKIASIDAVSRYFEFFYFSRDVSEKKKSFLKLCCERCLFEAFKLVEENLPLFWNDNFLESHGQLQSMTENLCKCDFTVRELYLAKIQKKRNYNYRFRDVQEPPPSLEEIRKNFDNEEIDHRQIIQEWSDRINRAENMDEILPRATNIAFLSHMFDKYVLRDELGTSESLRQAWVRSFIISAARGSLDVFKFVTHHPVINSIMRNDWEAQADEGNTSVTKNWKLGKAELFRICLDSAEAALNIETMRYLLLETETLLNNNNNEDDSMRVTFSQIHEFRNSLLLGAYRAYDNPNCLRFIHVDERGWVRHRAKLTVYFSAHELKLSLRSDMFYSLARSEAWDMVVFCLNRLEANDFPPSANLNVNETTPHNSTRYVDFQLRMQNLFEKEEKSSASDNNNNKSKQLTMLQRKRAEKSGMQELVFFTILEKFFERGSAPSPLNIQLIQQFVDCGANLRFDQEQRGHVPSAEHDGEGFRNLYVVYLSRGKNDALEQFFIEALRNDESKVTASNDDD